MKKLIATTTLCASLALSPLSVQPAHAISDEARAALIGLAGIAIIYGIADANKKQKKQRAHNPKRVKVADASCRRNQWTFEGNRRVYNARCLQRKTDIALPQACKFRVRTDEGVRRFYTADCLRSYGWRA